MIHRRRRLVQLGFLLLFLGLLTLTVWPLGQAYLGAFLLADPLVAAAAIAGGVARWQMGLAAVVVASAFLLGRVFCGYVCPLGLVIELTSPGSGVRRTGRLRHGRSGTPTSAVVARDVSGCGASPPASLTWLRRIPVYVLAVCLGLLLFGNAAYLVLDPLSLLTRTGTTLLFPLIDRGIRLAGDALYVIPPLRDPVDAVTSVATGRLLFAEPLTYGLQLITAGLFAGILALSLIYRRFWCRYLCPLGALLGQAGRMSPLGRVVDEEACIHCLRCARVCTMDAVRSDGLGTDPTRCQLGLECADVCPTQAISFGRAKMGVTDAGHSRPKVTHDPGRRALIGAGGLALAAGFFSFTGLTRAHQSADLIRPPGARAEPEFLSLCTRCGQCMKVCPSNVLQPCLWQAGWEGLYTPRMDFRQGACEWTCAECGEVCPTAAIRRLSLATKRVTVIGRAYLDHDRCLPWADNVECLVCQELCPTPEKAIVLQEAEVTDVERGPLRISRPVVVPERCIGCGICELHCPVAHLAAIRVSAPEDRRT